MRNLTMAHINIIKEIVETKQDQPVYRITCKPVRGWIHRVDKFQFSLSGEDLSELLQRGITMISTTNTPRESLEVALKTSFSPQEGHMIYRAFNQLIDETGIAVTYDVKKNSVQVCIEDPLLEIGPSGMYA